MKILFVSSGNSSSGISSLVNDQGDSLIKRAVEINSFTIIGKGYWGYIKNIYILRKHLKKHDYDLIHAHYSFSGFVAALASKLPVITSLMGSDIKARGIFILLIRFFAKYFWKAVIVKTKRMKTEISLEKSYIVPNGVDLNKFFEINTETAKKTLNFSLDKKHLIFVANPNQYVKNFSLAKEAYELLDNREVQLHVVSNVPHSKIMTYLSAADCLILTSFCEGSPNIIKEAMACNTPIVTTYVGDVEKLLDNVSGSYISYYNSSDFANCILKALKFNKRTNGREKIIGLKLDEKSIADKIITIYNSIINNSI